jgi:hypothetical protein
MIVYVLNGMARGLNNQADSETSSFQRLLQHDRVGLHKILIGRSCTKLPLFSFEYSRFIYPHITIDGELYKHRRKVDMLSRLAYFGEDVIFVEWALFSIPHEWIRSFYEARQPQHMEREESYCHARCYLQST